MRNSLDASAIFSALFSSSSSNLNSTFSISSRSSLYPMIDTYFSLYLSTSSPSSCSVFAESIAAYSSLCHCGLDFRCALPVSRESIPPTMRIAEITTTGMPITIHRSLALCRSFIACFYLGLFCRFWQVFFLCFFLFLLGFGFGLGRMFGSVLGVRSILQDGNPPSE